MKEYLVGLEYGTEIRQKTVIRAENEKQAAKLFVFGYNLHKTNKWDAETQTVDGQPVVVKEY